MVEPNGPRKALTPVGENYANPNTCLFHVDFKVSSCLPGNVLSFTLFFEILVIIIEVTVLLAALVFWVVKNVSGRILVGFRWWNESLARMNKKNPWLFWWTLYLNVSSYWMAVAYNPYHTHGSSALSDAWCPEFDRELNEVDEMKIHLLLGSSLKYFQHKAVRCPSSRCLCKPQHSKHCWIHQALQRFGYFKLCVSSIHLLCQDAKKQIRGYASQAIASHFTSTIRSAPSALIYSNGLFPQRNSLDSIGKDIYSWNTRILLCLAGFPGVTSVSEWVAWDVNPSPHVLLKKADLVLVGPKGASSERIIELVVG
ncbi:hypothetical protein SADUNF_Sadunf02G0171300 [Salix dunnii]|uniref:Golgi apparatus membrane protein TVP23 n=1 Tax=Salix dunnii TaxID=1413687 RepID=A0A835N8H7_9ROSI|nr:hypothetical protein SADUNF_Sadunf02G0171300 [Salix dunnii]